MLIQPVPICTACGTIAAWLIFGSTGLVAALALAEPVLWLAKHVLAPLLCLAALWGLMVWRIARQEKRREGV